MYLGLMGCIDLLWKVLIINLYQQILNEQLDAKKAASNVI